MSRPNVIELTDARAMRALAHPVRLRLLGVLRTEGPLTASEAGARIDESPASCSYHLRQLARFRFVAEAGPREGRRRRWRATAQVTAWGDGEAPEEQAAAAALTDVVIERYLERIRLGLERRLGLPRRWREATTFGDQDLHLTAGELECLTAGVAALVEPYAERTERPERRPRGARRISLLGFALPADG